MFDVAVLARCDQCRAVVAVRAAVGAVRRASLHDVDLSRGGRHSGTGCSTPHPCDASAPARISARATSLRRTVDGGQQRAAAAFVHGLHRRPGSA